MATIDEVDIDYFQWQDYLVFGIMLAVSAAIGLYFGIQSKRKHQASSDEMLTGNHKLPVFPVALSLSASFTSATTILGIPAEVYSRGGEQWIWCLGLIPCFLVVGFFILPIFYKLQLTNAYEYLELRFNYIIRRIGSALFCIIILIYMAAVLYAPAVALSQVTGLSREISILTMGLICTFYTAIGGIRAVVWTDAFQLIVVWIGLLALLFKGAEDAGGWTRVWEVAKDGDRLPRFDMDPDPFIRHTFWTLVIGGGTNMMTVYGANQPNLQRYSSVRSLTGSKIALLLNLPLWIIYLTILCLLGLVMYANFLTCDPLQSAQVQAKDQILPLFVLKTMGPFPGLPGLFVASVFSASISTLSSGINSLAAVTLEDVIIPCHKRVRHMSPTGTFKTVSTVLLVILFGAITIALAYLASLLDKTALYISFGVFGMVGGPLLGLIMNGIFIPFINSWGAFFGMLASLGMCLWVGIDPVINPPPPNNLPVRIDGCEVVNTTTSLWLSNATTMSSVNFTSTAALPAPTNDHLYLSYLHYSTLALLVSAIVGMIVSAITGCNKGRDVDERTYIHYGQCCSSKSSSSYDINDGDLNSHKRNSNLAKQEMRDDLELYSNVGVVNPASYDYKPSNGAYMNHSIE